MYTVLRTGKMDRFMDDLEVNFYTIVVFLDEFGIPTFILNLYFKGLTLPSRAQLLSDFTYMYNVDPHSMIVCNILVSC